MSVLTLVRHAQAAFFAKDYDCLSPLGREQACLLGTYWAQRGLNIGEVYTGPRARQRHTAELVAECYRKAGLAWPEIVVLDEMDEYDFGGILRRLAPELARRDSEFAAHVERYRRSQAEEDRMRTFQPMFEVLMHHWQKTSDSAETWESWPAFRARVRRGLDRILQRPGNGRRVAVFTSGGVIGTALHLALEIPDRMALELNWRNRNCSLTEFVFTQGRYTLDNFNMVPHLEDSALWTYR
jgi:broad specificity phosphatase PhoE